jgi:hypothetical protein
MPSTYRIADSGFRQLAIFQRKKASWTGAAQNRHSTRREGRPGERYQTNGTERAIQRDSASVAQRRYTALIAEMYFEQFYRACLLHAWQTYNLLYRIPGQALAIAVT